MASPEIVQADLSATLKRRRGLVCWSLGVATLCAISLLHTAIGADLSKEYGAECNPTGNPIGGGKGYTKLFTTGDFTVRTAEELLAALKKAKPGQVVYVAPDATIDLSGQGNVVVREGVTVAGSRGQNGSPGPLISVSKFGASKASFDFVFEARPGARITGLRIRGPGPGDQGVVPKEADSTGTAGVAARDKTEVDNCEISHFGYSGVHVDHGAAHVHHNFIHDIGAYPIILAHQAKPATLLEANIIHWVHHTISATGAPGTGYEARYNIVVLKRPFKAITPVPGRYGGHGFDVHAAVYQFPQHIASERISIHHNTMVDTGPYAFGVLIRGVPQDAAEIYNNWFSEADPSLGAQQLEPRGNFWVYNNVYGPKKKLVALPRECTPRIHFRQPPPPTFTHSPVTLSGDLALDLDATVVPGLQLRSVAVELDRVPIYSGAKAPASAQFVIDTRELSDGPHEIAVLAADTRGVRGQQRVFFKVSNAAAGQTSPPARLPVPAQSAMEKARSLLRERYKPDYEQANSAAQKGALARTLYSKAMGAAGWPAAQFVLFALARDIALRGEDLELALMAIDGTGERFQTEPFKEKVDVVRRMSREKMERASRRSLLEQSLELMRWAIDQDSFDLAEELGEIAQRQLGTVRDKPLLQALQARRSDLAQVRKAAGEIASIKEKLQAEPADPKANQELGRYLCLVRGQWAKGLPALARSGTPKLKTLAQGELAPPKDLAGQVALADGWFEMAGKEKGIASKQAQLRAAYWYAKALRQAQGPSSAQLRQRLHALAPTVNEALPKTIINQADGSLLVLIPAGQFLAGNPPFPVDLPAFYLGMYEATNAQYKRYIDATGQPAPEEKTSWSDRAEYAWIGRDHVPGEANFPIRAIPWDQADAYCRWAGLRLPTELEWEKGARGVEGRKFPWGSTWDATRCRNWSNIPGTAATQTCRVDDYPQGRSPWGLYNMAGNVWEWSSDWFDTDAYKRFQRGDLSLPRSSSQTPPVHTARGGSWENENENYFYCTGRRNLPVNLPVAGFRVARDIFP